MKLLLPSDASSPNAQTYATHRNITAPEYHSKITPGEKHACGKKNHNLLATGLLASKWTYCRHPGILNLFFTEPNWSLGQTHWEGC